MKYLFLLFLILLGFEKIFTQAHAATTTTTGVTQIIFPSKLGLTIPLFITFSPIASGIAGPQVSTALLSNIETTDTRSNDDVGWSVSVLCSDFVAINQPVLQKGRNDTVTAGGDYLDSQAGTYTITITQPGNMGVAKFSVRGLEDWSGLTGSNVTIGTKGVTASFAKANYAVGDSWTIRIDTIPVSNLTVTPLDLVATSGTKGGAQLGPKYTFLNKNDPTTLITVPSGEKNSSFSNNLLFSLNIPPFTFANTYKAQLTVTSD